MSIARRDFHRLSYFVVLVERLIMCGLIDDVENRAKTTVAFQSDAEFRRVATVARAMAVVRALAKAFGSNLVVSPTFDVADLCAIDFSVTDEVIADALFVAAHGVKDWDAVVACMHRARDDAKRT